MVCLYCWCGGRYLLVWFGGFGFSCIDFVFFVGVDV